MAPEALDALTKQELMALVLVLAEQNRGLAAQLAALQARIAELDARLGPPKTPDNSSLPPSRGQKADRPVKAAKPRQGRPGVARQLAEHPDQVREVFAETCSGCGHALAPSDQTEVARAYDHIELPPIKPVTTRLHLHGGACPRCGEGVTAAPPADMPVGSPFGPGIVAMVVSLHTRHMVSFSRLVDIFEGLFGLRVSQGAIANMLARAAAPFAAEAERIEAEVRRAPVITCDETSARVDGHRCWPWVFGCATAVCHRIAPSRGAAVVADVLQGATPEVWVSDRFSAQSGHAQAHQLCLAHLLRDAQYAMDAGDKLFAPGFKFLLKRALAIGRRQGSLADSTLRVYRRHLEQGLDRLLACEPATAAGRKLRNGIARAKHKLFVFVTRRDVPPTNTLSERALRPAVIFRKVSNGFRSAWGAAVYAAVLSITATAALRGIGALDAIRTCLAGHTLTTA